MSILKRILIGVPLAILVLVAGFDIWGRATLGTLTPDPQASRDPGANRVVMVLGATGSVGDGLLKAAMEDPLVEQVHVVTRRTSPRIDDGVDSGRLSLHMLEDFTDYSSLASELAGVNTVLWGLGTSSLKVDDATYTLIHVDFPMAFLQEWLAARSEAPMAFHYVTGMGTDPEGDAHWAQEKGRLEREMAAIARGTPLRTFSYRSAYVRPTSERAHPLAYLGEQLLKPGYLVITARELGQSMLEISTRTEELPNGTLIDNADSIAYAEAYREANERR